MLETGLEMDTSEGTADVTDAIAEVTAFEVGS